MEYEIVKVVHIISSTVLFGTGIGSAYYMWRANTDGDIGAIVFAAKNVVLADWVFTTPSIILQPLTGLAMVFMAGFPLTAPWVLASIGLYMVAGLCWLPVVVLQIRMRDMAIESRATGAPLPPAYHAAARRWLRLGIPAFASIVVVFFLMVTKPNF